MVEILPELLRGGKRWSFFVLKHFGVLLGIFIMTAISVFENSF
ncbi:hypothetical protein X975_02224, partial [Stegodyphus mimosarum]